MSKIEIKKDSIVRKQEGFLKSRYQLSELAMKIVTIVYTQIKEDDPGDKQYIIEVANLKNLMGKDYKNFYTLVKEAFNELLSNPIKIEDKEKKQWITFNWLSYAKYNNGIVTCDISPSIRPYIISFKQRYLKYKLENILSLKGVYVIRLYEALKNEFNLRQRYSKKDACVKTFSVDEIFELLDAPKSYKWGGESGIRNRVLVKAKKEFAAHADIIFDYEENKKGRATKSVTFTIKENSAKVVKKIGEYDLKSFVTDVRSKYCGNGKSFGITSIDGQWYCIALDFQGYMFAKGLSNPNKIIDFDASESKVLYSNWTTIANHYEPYKDLVDSEMDICEFIKDKDNLNNLIDAIGEMKSKGMLKKKNN